MGYFSRIVSVHTRIALSLSRISGLSDNAKEVIKTILQGIAAAMGAVLFMVLIHVVFESLFDSLQTLEPWKFLLFSFLIIMTSSSLVAFLLREVPEAAGSGIPQAKLAYWKELGYIPFKTVWVKFLAGIVSVGGGASLGREGPTVFLGSGIASTLDGLMGANKRSRRASTAVGAAAGLAAAFNTPLAAITFCIEELIGDLNTRYLGKVVLAALIGALTVYAFVGRQPSFALPDVAPGPWFLLLLIPLVALTASGLGILFHEASLRLRLKVKRQKKFPVWLAPIFGGLFTWMVAAPIFLVTGKMGVFGLGYHDLSATLQNGAIWWIALILAVGKLIATVFSYGFGGCGGIFSPTLFIGGLAGASIAGIFQFWIPLSQSDVVILASVGMSACMGSVIRAPLTSTLIVFEMTHQFEIVPGLILSAAISMLMTKFFGPKHNFYDDLLIQEGHEIHKIIPPKDLQAWQNLSVGRVMNTKPTIIESWDADGIAKTLRGTPYRIFVVTEGGVPTGLVSRKMLGEYVETASLPILLPIVGCSEETSIREASGLFISSPEGFIAVTNECGRLVGIMTLHDLLRAQVAATE